MSSLRIIFEITQIELNFRLVPKFRSLGPWFYTFSYTREKRMAACLDGSTQAPTLLSGREMVDKSFSQCLSVVLYCCCEQEL